MYMVIGTVSYYGERNTVKSVLNTYVLNAFSAVYRRLVFVQCHPTKRSPLGKVPIVSAYGRPQGRLNKKYVISRK